MEIFICISLAVVMCLIVLNGFLFGDNNSSADLFLGVVWLGLVIVSFVAVGWKPTLLALAIAFVSAVLARSFLAGLASRILSASARDSGGEYVGLPPLRLRLISRDLARPTDLGAILNDAKKTSNVHHEAEEALLDYCESQESIRQIMEEYGLSRGDMQDIYSRLIFAGAGLWACGHWVAASAIAYPDSLRFALDNRQSDWVNIAGSLVMFFERGEPLG